MDISKIFSVVMQAVQQAPKVVATAPAFVDLVKGVMPMFTGAQQEQLKSALAQARAKSDEAQDDFVRASKGG